MSREFNLLQFAAHMATVSQSHHLGRASYHDLKKAAKLVEDEAKEILGTYQSAEGEFAAWAKLADATKERREKAGYTPDDPLLASGALKESIHYSVYNNAAAVGSNDPKAEWLEQGTEKMPPRSFFGNAGVRTGEKVAEILGHGVYMSVAGKRL